MGLEGPATLVSVCCGCRLVVTKEGGSKEGKGMKHGPYELRAIGKINLNCIIVIQK